MPGCPGGRNGPRAHAAGSAGRLGWLYGHLHPVRALPASHSRCSKLMALSQNEGDGTKGGDHKSTLPASAAGCAALGDCRAAAATAVTAAASSLGTPCVVVTGTRGFRRVLEDRGGIFFIPASRHLPEDPALTWWLHAKCFSDKWAGGPPGESVRGCRDGRGDPSRSPAGQAGR